MPVGTGAGCRGTRRGAQGSRSRCRDEARRQTTRRRRRANSSTAARSRLQSKRGNRRIPSRDYACHTCHSRSSTEFVKTFGIGSFERGGPRARSGPRTKTLKCVGKENTGAKQTQTRCNCLNHRKTLRVLAGTQRHEAAHSQKDSLPGPKDPAGVMLRHNSLAGEGSIPVAATIDSPRRCSPHFRRVRDAVSSCLDAEVAHRGDTGVRQVGARPVKW